MNVWRCSGDSSRSHCELSYMLTLIRRASVSESISVMMMCDEAAVHQLLLPQLCLCGFSVCAECCNVLISAGIATSG